MAAQMVFIQAVNPVVVSKNPSSVNNLYNVSQKSMHICVIFLPPIGLVYVEKPPDAWIDCNLIIGSTLV